MDVEVQARTQQTWATADQSLHFEGSRPALGLLIIACLFAVAGGYMDAYSYLAHGHVFANAQTGNFVLFSVETSQGHWSQAVRHLPPIVASSLGVAVSTWLTLHVEGGILRATLFCQAFEVAILVALASVGARLPDAAVVPLMSFVAALQITSLNRVGAWPFSSAMMTSNLRDVTAGLVLWSAGREAVANRNKAITLSVISISFVMGALIGGCYTRLNGDHALVPCVMVVATGFLLTCWEQRRAKQASTAASAMN